MLPAMPPWLMGIAVTKALATVDPACANTRPETSYVLISASCPIAHVEAIKITAMKSLILSMLSISDPFLWNRTYKPPSYYEEVLLRSQSTTGARLFLRSYMDKPRNQ